MEFRDIVYEICSRIPKGKVSTYKEIAKAARNTKAYRAVGRALKNNPYAPAVPCHRVVKSDGNIGGYFGDNPKNIRAKIKILKSEGVKIKNNKIVDFDDKLFRF